MFVQHYRTLIRVALVVYWSALFVGTHMPTVPAGVAEISDKLLHYLAFGGLACLLAMDQHARSGISWRRSGQIWVAVAVYAAADELLQIPVGRTADIRDWIADVFGAACGLIGYMLICRAVCRMRGISPTDGN